MPNAYEYREYEYYCPKCGNSHFITYGSDELCLVCKTKMIESPHEFNLSQAYMDNLLKMGWNENKQLFEQNEQRLFDEVIRKSPEFDINLYNNRDSILAQQQQQQEEAIAHGKAVLEGKDKGNPYSVECPYCHATNVKKITTTSKVVNTAIFGIFGTKRHKQWHCNQCNSDF